MSIHVFTEIVGSGMPSPPVKVEPGTTHILPLEGQPLNHTLLACGALDGTVTIADVEVPPSMRPLAEKAKDLLGVASATTCLDVHDGSCEVSLCRMVDGKPQHEIARLAIVQSEDIPQA